MKKALSRLGKEWAYEARIINLFDNRTVAYCHAGLWQLLGNDENAMPWSEFVTKFKELFEDAPPAWIAANPDVDFPARAMGWSANNFPTSTKSGHVKPGQWVKQKP